MKNLQNAINNASNDSLSELTGMVYQIWDDGEITLQKSGDLLWQRSLHGVNPAIGVVDDIEWPHIHGKHSYAFVSRDDAESIREMIREEILLEISSI